MDQLKVTVNGDTKELIVREGSAIELKEPLQVNISGDIDTVKSFVDKRYSNRPKSVGAIIEESATVPNYQLIDKSKAVVTFDKDKLSISLDVNPQDAYGPTVKGALIITEELKQFFINEQKYFDREALLKLVRFNKRFFTDKERHQKILEAFTKLNLTGKTELQASSDNRGNKGSTFNKELNTDSVPTDFFLEVPIFKGQKPVKFLVEICLENSESAVRFWLESVELVEAKDKIVDEIFAEQKKHYTDFVIVNK